MRSHLSCLWCLAFLTLTQRSDPLFSTSHLHSSLLVSLGSGLQSDATLGWAVSWAIGPSRLAAGTLTLSVWLYTATFVVGLGAIYGLIGGGIGALTGRRRVA